MSDNAFPTLAAAPVYVPIPLVVIDVNQLEGKSEADQKQYIGNYIYSFVEQHYPM